MRHAVPTLGAHHRAMSSITKQPSRRTPSVERILQQPVVRPLPAPQPEPSAWSQIW